MGALPRKLNLFHFGRRFDLDEKT
ncbi:MAG: hypothetical protein RL698_2746, partial [Pseudomonadota bacterium]